MALFRLALARVSSQDQNIELQISQFEQLGYDELFQEKMSGRKRDRPEFTRLTERALHLRGQGHDVVVYVIEWTRWARDTAFALDSLKLLEDAGAQVVEVTTGQPVTMETASGLLTAGMKSVMAHYYSVELSERLKRAYSARKQKGRGTGNRPVLGYQAGDDKKWEPSKDWAVAREAIERFMDGDSINGICRWLAEDHGISRSRHGFLAWLKHPAIRGHSRFRSELLYNTHPPLITELEWRQIQNRIQQNKQLKGANTGRIHAVPAGFCRCTHCKRALAVKVSAHGRYFFCYYRCSLRDGSCNAPRKYCRDHWVEAAIQEAILERAEELANALLTPETATNPLIIEREKQLEGLRALPFHPATEIAIEAIEAELKQIRAGEEAQFADRRQREQMIQDLAWISPQDWAQLTKEQRRTIYSDLVQAVDISGKDIIRVRFKD